MWNQQTIGGTPIMNIYALPGYKVRSAISRGNIKKGNEYTVHHTEVAASSTDVFLQELPGTRFNSVNFDDVSPQQADLNRCHPDHPNWIFQNIAEIVKWIK